MVRTTRSTPSRDTPLLYVLRDDLKLNAAKFGCGLGQCGACTVIVDGKAVLSCVTPLLLLEGKKVTTLEGLGTIEAPAPIQRAFIEEQAAQCGYCIAGMMMRAQALLQRNSKPTDAQIRAELELNLCRCGTHMRILRAVHRASQLMQTADASPVAKEHTMNAPVISQSPQRARGRRRLDRQLLARRRLRAGPGRAGRAAAKPPPAVLQESPFLDSWIRIDADGSITVFTGKAELGQGFRTACQQIAAEELDVPFASLKLVTADTSRTANEGYTSGSNSMKDSGTAIQQRRRAGARALDRGGGAAARTAGGKPEDRKWRGDRARRPAARLWRAGCRRHAACAGAGQIEAEGSGRHTGSWASRYRAWIFPQKSPAAPPMSRTCACPAWCMPAWCGRRAMARN